MNKGQFTNRMSARSVEDKVVALTGALSMKDRAPEVLEIFRQMWTAGGLRNPDEEPRWSGVTDDSSPVEFSAQFRQNGHDLRILFEPQADPASPQSYWRAGTRMTRWLAARWKARVEPALAIEPLFRPLARARVHLAMGHGVDIQTAGPMFKVYYNAMARGATESRELVAEALSRLGFERTWTRLAQNLDEQDRIELLALDLAEPARIKLYLRPLGANMRRLERLYSLAEDAPALDVSRTWKAIHGEAKPETMRPVFLTYQLVHPGALRPARTTLSVPLFPGLRSDGQARSRISRLMDSIGINSAVYRKCVAAMADGPLGSEEGIHSYVALQRHGAEAALVTYFNPRLYYHRYGWIARDPVRTWPSAIVVGD
jgi:DMATS type aromatic prenyltransferase